MPVNPTAVAAMRGAGSDLSVGRARGLTLSGSFWSFLIQDEAVSTYKAICKLSSILNLTNSLSELLRLICIIICTLNQ